MTKKFWEQVKKALKLQKRRSRWHKLVYGMAMIVVFCTTYALILPAITMETGDKSICGLEEHVHIEECYEEQQRLFCELEEDESHTHTESCYEIEMVSVCALEEHVHTGECDAGSAVQQEEPADNVLQPENTETTNQPKDAEAAVTESTDPAVSLLETGEQSGTTGGETSNDVPGADAGNTENQTQTNPNGYEMVEPSVYTTPLPLAEYITNAVLKYRVGTDSDWQEVTAGTTLPGNAELRLEISYANVHVNDLRGAGLQMTYTLPQILRVKTGSGPILDDNENHMGTMTVTAEDRLVTLTFDETWLNTHHSSSGQDQISGKFYVDSGIDLTQASQTPSTTITVGDVTINLNFATDLIAKYANVTIQKSNPVVAIHDDTGDYLEYTLTVTAGQDGAVDVVVKDAFQQESKSIIVGYVGISSGTQATGSIAGPTDTGVSAGGTVPVSMDGTTMNWTIGAMNPNETRTLTYRVKLKDGYLGGKTPTASVGNTADLFCGGNDRGEDSAIFTPKAEATLSKVASQFTPDGNGGGTIQYTIWIHADDKNNYTLTNVKVWDALDGSIDNNNATNQNYLPWISFVEGSFRLYAGGSNMQNGSSGLTPIEGSPINPVFQNKSDGTQNKHFITYDAGTLAPGESKTLTYTLCVDPGVFPAAGNNTPKINNRAQIHVGDAEKGNETKLESYNAYKDITKKEWSSKQSGTRQTEAQTVSIPAEDAVYAANGSLVENHQTKFTAPAGSYLYHVSVNKAGDWNVSKASLKDQLLGEYSKFVGYVQVSAYNVGASGNRTLDKTVWLSVDNLREFTFKPSDVGFAAEPQAYELTYYTSVTIPDGAPQVNVENTFTMSGGVGLGTNSYTLAGAYVTASNIVQGENHFSVSKRGWYYEPSKVSSGEYAHGAIYWYIKVDGTEIPADTRLKDTTAWNTQYIYDSSLIGLYTGKPGEISTSYDDWAALQASSTLTKLPESDYTVTIEPYVKDVRRFPTITVRLTNSVTLSNGDSLFLILKMESHVNPAGEAPTDKHLYQNKVQSSYDGSNWVDGNTASLTIYGANGISKTLEKVSSWDGTTETVVEPADVAADSVTLTGLESGTYVFWNVQLNYTGRLHGSYYVEELIPDGMKLAYVQCTGVGAGYKTTKPSCVQKSPGADWKDSLRTEGVLPTYFYTNGQTARWYVDGLQTGNNDHTIDFRVVCRVTDEDVLLGGTEKEFLNQVKLFRESGKQIDSSSNSVSLQTQSLSKQGIYNKEEPTKFPFKVTLNPLGEDLVPEANTLSLVDTLSNTLILDLSSIQVKETGTNNVVTDWESAVDGQTLTLTLPDQRALTITYSAWINARPGDVIDISNNAHWEGHPTPSGAAVGEKNFEFAILGSGSTDEYPSIQITKRDANHLATALAGAGFKLTEAEVKSDGTVGVKDKITDGATGEQTPIEWTGETDANGLLSFGNASGQTMKYNTIYCLTETQAPGGYVLDSTPHYFVIAKKETVNGVEAYPTFPQNVHVHYTSSMYSYQALNYKGRITVQKKFSDPGGNDRAPVDGTYSFGLYTTADGSGTSVDTVTITYSAMDTEANKTAVFKDLPLNQTYYVFELDSDGKPIVQDGYGWIGNQYFEVTYENANGLKPSDNASVQTKVTITNRLIPTYVMPGTGGMGTGGYYLAGLAIMVGTGLGYCKKNRKKSKA